MNGTGGSFMQQPLSNSEGVRRCLTIPDAPRSSQLRYQPQPPYAAGSPAKMARPSSAPVSRQLGMQGKAQWEGANYREPPPVSRQLGMQGKAQWEGANYREPPPVSRQLGMEGKAQWEGANYREPPPVSRQLGMEGKSQWKGANFREPRQFGQVYAPPSRGYKILDSNLRLPYAARKAEAFVNSTLGYPRVENGKSVPIPSYEPMLDPHLVDYFHSRFGQVQLEELKRQRWLNRYGRPRSAGSLTLGSRRSFRYGAGGKDGGGGGVLYKVAVTTGDVKNAGTDAKVFLKIKGSKGKLPKTRLTKKAGSVKSNRGVAFRFAKASTHVFKIRGANIGDIQSLIIETSAVKKEEAWFLQEIEIVNTKTKKTWLFTCNQWFSLYHGDGQVMREFFPIKSAKTEYEIVTVTGDLLGGGTNANVFLTVFGKTGTTRKVHLKNSSKTMFKRGSSDVFRVKTNCVGPMKKIRIEHDNTGVGSGWYLERVVVTDLHNTQWKYFFPCGQWLSKTEGDRAICRDLIGSHDPLATRKASKYKVSVFTGNKRGAGSDANVYITMFGEFGDSGEKKLSSRKNNFERGKMDEFLLECPKLGRLERIRVGHDNSGFGPGWFLDKNTVNGASQV
ncbi:hypothetical protein ACOMHN_007619 [Nucella lapillus]